MSQVNHPPVQPPWPSLYNPGLEIFHIDHRGPVQEGAYYLYNSYGACMESSLETVELHFLVPDVFRFTLYWNLIFYTPLFIICGTYAFLNLSFPPLIPSISPSIPLTSLSATSPSAPPYPRTKSNERRSRLSFAILVLFTFLALSVAWSVLGGAIVGYVLAGLYKAAGYNMST
jgi:hypothetical protein